MSEPTKACNLTKTEIECLIRLHGDTIGEDMSDAIERINYLHKRLKSFDDELPAAVASTANAAGWGTSNG